MRSMREAEGRASFKEQLRLSNKEVCLPRVIAAFKGAVQADAALAPVFERTAQSLADEQEEFLSTVVRGADDDDGAAPPVERWASLLAVLWFVANNGLHIGCAASTAQAQFVEQLPCSQVAVLTSGCC